MVTGIPDRWKRIQQIEVNYLFESVAIVSSDQERLFYLLTVWLFIIDDD